MDKIKIGSSTNKKGVTVNPSVVLFNGNNIIWPYIPLIPKMTSNTTPSGKCIGGSIVGGYPLYYAFDQNTNTFYACSDTSNNGTNSGDKYIGYVFDNRACVRSIVFTNSTSYGIPTKFTIEGSNDGTNWDILGTFTNNATNTGQKWSKELNNRNYYTHYVLRCLSFYGGATFNVGELQFYGYY